VRTLVIRADAGARVGTGHLMRCLALAQAWQAEGGRAIFLSHCESESLRQRIEGDDIQFVSLEKPHPDSLDLQKTLEFSEQQRANWIVLDGYHFDSAYQAALRNVGKRVLVIDDTAHLPHYHADILLNQNIYAPELKYHGDADTTFLLGARYALLRHEFLRWNDWQREIPDTACHVLVTFGGSDAENVTLKVMRAIERAPMDALEVVVVVGGSNPHFQRLMAEAANSKFKMRVERDAANVPDLMAWADIAISGAGSTCWEMAFMRLPALLVVIAENQRRVAQGLDDAKIARDAGWHAALSPDEIGRAFLHMVAAKQARAEMSRRGGALVDGEGAQRVTMHLLNRAVRLRTTRAEDCRMIWEWANDAETRRFSFSTDPIPWERHLEWFNSKLSSSNCYFYLALDRDDAPVAQIRFDLNEATKDEATVSITVAPHQRGKGYGAAVIEAGSEKFCATSTAKVIHAYVKPENAASIHAFEKAAYGNMGMMREREHKVLHLTRSRP